MTKKARTSVHAFALLALVAHAAGSQEVEESIEARTDTVSMATAAGPIAVRSCKQCPERFLTLTNRSKFFVGEQEVSFDELRRTLATGPRLITFHYRPADKAVTRVMAAQ